MIRRCTKPGRNDAKSSRSPGRNASKSGMYPNARTAGGSVVGGDCARGQAGEASSGSRTSWSDTDHLGRGDAAKFVALKGDLNADPQAYIWKRLSNVTRELVERESETLTVGRDFAQAEIIDADDSASFVAHRDAKEYAFRRKQH